MTATSLILLKLTQPPNFFVKVKASGLEFGSTYVNISVKHLFF